MPPRYVNDLNALQELTISSAGQQALEGRRVPIMASYKTLPSFQPFENSARSHGMVYGSFLGGIRPQVCSFVELNFIHCCLTRRRNTTSIVWLVVRDLLTLL